jgi:hypothetical protein
MPETLNHAQSTFYRQNGFLMLENKIPGIWLKKSDLNLADLKNRPLFLSKAMTAWT